MPRRLLAALTAFALMLPAGAARADVESWNWFEARVPLTEGQYGLPNSLRFFTDARFATRYANGLGQLFFRVGPIWQLHPNMFLATHYTVYPNQFAPETAPGDYEVVHRLEFEPNFHGRLGAFTFNDRNRLEYATSARSTFWRYRNQLRLNYMPEGETRRWFPYVWDEVMIPFDVGFNQNRASVGVGVMLGEHARLDTGYLLRSRANGSGAWEHDHILNVYLFYAPSIPATLLPAVPAGE